MSHSVSSTGTWTWLVFLSTVRLRRVLSRSSVTVCQWKSSNRLPNETRSWPPENELIPENKEGKKKSRFQRNYLKSSSQFTIILLHQVPDIHHHTLAQTGWECFRNGQASNTQTYGGKVSQLPHYTTVGVLLFKIYFGRIPNHSQDSRTATSLYPSVPVQLYFLNNWYLYILYGNKYNDGPSHYKFPLYFLLYQKHPF